METRRKNSSYLSKSYKPAAVTELPKGDYPDFVSAVGETIDDPQSGGYWVKLTLLKYIIVINHPKFMLKILERRILLPRF